MKSAKLHLFFLGILMGCVAHAQYKWADPLQQTAPVLRGQAWQEELKGTYVRLPLGAEGKVRTNVWDLSRNSAGLSVAFRSNASEIKVRYLLKGGRAMLHMPATGVSGLDLYATDANGQSRWCRGNYSFGDTVTYTYKDLTYFTDSVKGYEYELFLPLYNTVEWMEIGVPSDALFRFLSVSQEKPIVIYGTSIAQGACASRPGMAWTNIVNRKLQHPVINLGFSGNGKLEPELFELLSEINAGMYIIDCIPNLVNKDSEVIYERTLQGVSLLREKSQAPILLVEHSGYTHEFSNKTAGYSYKAANKELLRAYQELISQEVKQIYYLTKEEIGLSMDAMVEGVHPSDLGMQQYADSYIKKIKAILREEIESPFSSCIPCKQHRDPYDWNDRHEEILKMNKESVADILLFGNSITHYWGGEPVSDKQYLMISPDWYRYITHLVPCATLYWYRS